jgi:quercetin dioxygenase-like cupin family protein
MIFYHCEPRRFVVVALMLGLLRIGEVSSAEQTSVVIPIEEAVFAPAGARETTTLSSALLLGTKESPSMILVKLTKGSTDKHSHKVNQEVVVIKGELRLWEEGMQEPSGKLRPGSFWYEKSGVIHQNTCESDECIIFVHGYPPELEKQWQEKREK